MQRGSYRLGPGTMSGLPRDPEATAAALERWLVVVAGLEDVEVTNLAIPQSTGWSNETIMFDAIWRRSGTVEHRELVARIAPTDYTVFPDRTFTAQYDVMRALAEHSDVPMARIHWLERSAEWFGSEFWIMDRIGGDIPADTPPYASQGWLHDASLDDQSDAWWNGIEAMAGIHRLDPDRMGIRSTPVPHGPDPLTAHLDHQEYFLGWAEGDRPHVGARKALADLRADMPGPPVQGASLVWGDARLSNLIYRDFEVVAVLDLSIIHI